MEKDVLTEKIKDYLANEISDDDFNNFVELANSYKDFLCDDEYFYMYELDDLLSGKTPTEIIDMVDDNFDVNDEYFRFTIYGIESCSGEERDYSGYIDELTDFIVNNIDNIEKYYNCGITNWIISDIIIIRDGGDDDAE